MKSLIAVILAAVIFTAPAQADLAGRDDPAFVTALDAWLAGEDLAALEAFAALAREGSTATQIFLGQVEPVTYLHGHVTGSMERKARIALLKEEGGLSGKSWLAAAAETDPLAGALRDSRSVETRAAAIPILLEAGEVRTLLPAIIAEVNHGSAVDLMDVILDPRVSPHAKWIAAQLMLSVKAGSFAPAVPSEEALSDWRERLSELRPGEADRLIFFISAADMNAAAPDDPGDTARVFASAPAAVPLVGVCEALCPETTAQCALALGVAAQDMGPASMATLSPIEALVPSDIYRASARFTTDLLRQASRSSNGARVAANTDACLARHLETIK